MYLNYTFWSVNNALPRLLGDITSGLGKVDESRAGKTLEMTHVGITLTDPNRREILLDGRKANIAAQIAETMWVLSGRNDIEFLNHYLPRAADFSDDGKTWRAGYGPRLRCWPGVRAAEPVDQFRTVLDLLRKDPNSRRAVMSIWDPARDYQDSKDIPCNNWLSWSARDGKLDLHVAIRSNDIIWGWSGINQFEWSALLEIMAGLLGLQVGSLHFSITSLHLYERHWAKAANLAKLRTAHTPTAAGSPRFELSDSHRVLTVAGLVDAFDNLIKKWFEIEETIRKGGEANTLIETFPEPMLRSWLRVIAWWWSGDREFLAALEGTDLERACEVGVQPPEREFVTLMADEQPVARLRVDHPTSVGDPVFKPSEFVEEICKLHLEKHAAYGDSWVKRGELFSILPNVGRKVDRLGGGETADENSADTAGDLFVYLAKYLSWLTDPDTGKDPRLANAIMVRAEKELLGRAFPLDEEGLVHALKTRFEDLLQMAEAGDPERRHLVVEMLNRAYMLAYILWSKEMGKAMATRVPGGPSEYRGADVD